MIETYACFHVDYSTDRIETQNPVEVCCVEGQPTSNLRGIAVRTGQTASNEP
jgi:hypothetical protein